MPIDDILKASKAEQRAEELGKNADKDVDLSDQLKKPADQLSPTEKKALEEAKEAEKEARLIGKEMVLQGAKVAETMFTMLATQLDLEKHFKKEEKDEIKNIFSETVMQRMQTIPDALYKNLKEGKGVIFNCAMNETTIDFLDSILEFKKKIDQKFPGMTDSILKVAAPALTAGITMISPAAGVVLKSTGVLDKAADFLQTKNLEESIKKLKEGMKEIEKDKQLKAAMEKGEKNAQAGKVAGISARIMGAIQIPDRMLSAIIDDAKAVPEAVNFAKDMAKYTEQVIPLTLDDAKQNVEAIKTQIIEKMTEAGLPTEKIEEISKQIDKKMEGVEKKLAESLEKENFFDKVVVQQEAAKLAIDGIESIAKDVAKAAPSMAGLEKTVKDAAVKVVTDKIKGEAGKLIEAAKDPKLKESAKKMGASIRSNVAVARAEKAASQAAGLSQAAGGRGA